MPLYLTFIQVSTFRAPLTARGELDFLKSRAASENQRPSCLVVNLLQKQASRLIRSNAQLRGKYNNERV